METWQLQEAKNKLSRVVDLAQSGRPQYITRHGKPVAVLSSVEDYERGHKKPVKDFKEFLLSLPRMLEEEDLVFFDRIKESPVRTLDWDV